MKRTLPNENEPTDKVQSKRPERDIQPTLKVTVVDGRQPKAPKNEQEAAKLKALREQMKRNVAAYHEEIVTSRPYADDTYQYRHVILPKQLLQYLPDPKDNILLKENEYRRLGVKVTSGWEHYMIYQPEPHILLLRRTHEVAAELKKAYEEEKKRKAKAKAKELSTAATSSGSKRTSSKPEDTTTTATTATTSTFSTTLSTLSTITTSTNYQGTTDQK